MLTGRIAAFLRDLRGVSAVEFALIAPLMILTYAGLAETTMAMMAHHRASHAASVVGDLVAQSVRINTAELADIFEVSEAVMTPMPIEGLAIRVTSVVREDDDVEVAWSRASGTSAHAEGDPMTGPFEDLLEESGSLIVAEVSYTYSTPLGMALPEPLTFTETYYLRPRRAAQVDCTNC